MFARSRAAVWGSALAIGLFQVIGSFGAANNQPERKAMDALAIALVLAGPLVLAWRDRWPVIAVAVATAAVDIYIGAGYAYGPIFVSVVVALFCAVGRGHRRTTWMLAAAGYAGYVAAVAVDPNGEGAVDGAGHLALVAAWLAATLALAELVRTRRSESADRARAAEEERQRRAGEQRLALAQDVHDVLAHHISLINVQAGVALHLIDEHPERAGPALASIKEASREALGELRTALDLLRRGEEDAPRAPAPGLSDLDDLISSVRASGLDVRLAHDGWPDAQPPPPAAVQLAAFRIVQEALTNVARHARATSVTVTLNYDSGVSIEVIDDGVGAAGSGAMSTGGTSASGAAAGGTPGGSGIVGMRRRAEALGGTVAAGPVPGEGGGFRVRAHLPMVDAP
jgi:signal transduction histidine kinase